LLNLKKKETSASDEACEDENSKFVGTIGNDPATWPGVKSRKVRGYLAQREPQPQQKFSPATRVMHDLNKVKENEKKFLEETCVGKLKLTFALIL